MSYIRIQNGQTSTAPPELLVLHLAGLLGVPYAPPEPHKHAKHRRNRLAQEIAWCERLFALPDTRPN